MTFSDLGINENINQALVNNKITIPTDIQVEAIPHILKSSQHLVAVAQTGTGKTAAFSLPILQNIDSDLKKIQALILVPTRELGQQVAREFFLFSKFSPRVFAEAIYGGTPIVDQIEKLKRPTHLLVATPGRLLDLLNRKALSLDHLKYVVLDEADEMINMGFKNDIDQVLERCKSDVTKLLFTATLPKDIKQIIHDYLGADYKELHVNAKEFVNQNIEHQYLLCKGGEKFDYLKALLAEKADQRGILFCDTKSEAKRLAKKLAGFVVTSDAIHGNLNQEMREKVMRGFKKNRINLLIATDIAARGIDVKELDYILHYDLPEKAEQYTHRSGRTARAGKSGISISFVKNNELDEMKRLESQLNISFSRIEVDLLEEKKDWKPVNLFMNMGYVQNFDEKSLRDFLIEEAGVDAGDLSNIVVAEEHASFIISEKYVQQIIFNLKGFKICHRNLKLWIKE